MEENPRQRFRVSVKAILLIVAIFAVYLVVAIQQLQIARQLVEIGQLRKQNAKYSGDRQALLKLLQANKELSEKCVQTIRELTEKHKRFR